MGYLKIEKVTYSGKNYFYESPELSKKINFLIGENGNGKSTFANLVYYGLGNKVPYFENSKSTKKRPIQEIVSDENNYIELLVEINGKKYEIKRGIGKNKIKISTEDNSFVLPIDRNDNLFKTKNSIFSDWLLTELKIGKLVMEQFGTTHHINFDDLSRLLYYDQKSNKEDIYKEPEEDNYFKKSSIIKNAIFETLIGSTFQEYYNKFFELKKKEKEAESLRSKIKTLELEIGLGKNINFNNLKGEIEKKKEKKSFIITELTEKRKQIKINRFSSTQQISNIETTQKLILEKTIEEKELISEIRDFSIDLEKSLRAKEIIEKDISHINKILYTSQNITKRNKNNCPFCNEAITIQNNKCICGSDHGLDYEKFMYSDEEYISMLKSKSKTLLTINDSLKYCETELEELNQDLEEIKKEITQKSALLKALIEETSTGIGTHMLDELEGQLYSCKEELLELNKTSEKINEILKERENLSKIENDIFKINSRLIELASEKKEIISKNYKEFTEIYQNYIKEYYKSIEKEMPSLYLNSSYMPELDFYQEDSAYEIIKFFYYLSLMKLSLRKDNVSFPKFLIFDGFDSGLDKNKINICYEKMINLVEEYKEKEFQILITNRHDTFEKEKFKGFVVDELFDEKPLLKLR